MSLGLITTRLAHIDGPLPMQEIVPADPEGHQLQSAHLIGDRLLALIYLRPFNLCP